MTGVRRSITPRILGVVLVLLALIPASSATVAQSANSYIIPDFGVTISWTDDWQIAPDGEHPNAIGLVRGNSIELWIDVYGPHISPRDAVEPLPDDVVVTDESDANPPWAIFDIDGNPLHVQAFTLESGSATVVASIYTTPDLLSEVTEIVSAEITLDGAPFFSDDTSADVPGTGESSNVTRTTRTGTQGDPGLTESGLESFTGPVYGYSLAYDPEIWRLDAEINEGAVDGIRLVSESSTFTVWAWDNYGTDAAACLAGEERYYSSAVEDISDWQPAIGADGQELRYESADLAWGVFSLTYTTSRGTEMPLIDYISCEPIPGQDAMLIVLLSANPDPYNSELDNALDVLDTLQFTGTPTQDVPDVTETVATETPVETPMGDIINTNLDGSSYTSPNYGYTADIPLEWQILEESVDGGDERLVVGNGTSIVTLWATNSYTGDLAGCVDYAAINSGLDLQLDYDSTGGEFRGVYRNEAFANFVYEDNGVQMMYFVNCQAIPGTDAHLILIHDVEYDLFTGERRFRADIENSIVMP